MKSYIFKSDKHTHKSSSVGFFHESAGIQMKLLKQSHVKARSCNMEELCMRSQIYV